MDLIRIVWKDVVWIDLAQDRGNWQAVVNMFTDPRVP